MINTNQNDLSGNLAIDYQGLGELRQAAQKNSPEALTAAAKQFEAVFMNMMLKSMRDATPQEGVFDNEQSKMYTSMLDQQLSQNLAKRGVGLADVLIRQLSSAVAGKSTPEQTEVPLLSTPPEARSHRGSKAPHIKAFQEKLSEHAAEASKSTGIPAKFMIAQAALESGWGKREIPTKDGVPSHNLFGIKATGNWHGRVTETATTEYVNGVLHTKMAKFRAYDSYADAFRDYANLLKNNPRYQKVLANAQDVQGFTQGLQSAGYATDPHYASKLARIINHSLA